jgi:hypothetical protein
VAVVTALFELLTLVGLVTIVVLAIVGGLCVLDALEAGVRTQKMRRTAREAELQIRSAASRARRAMQEEARQHMRDARSTSR